jgi:uncharacterized membrane-anchored protein
MRYIVLGAMTVIILTVINIEIAGKERIVRNGATMLLRLAPMDPRSLMQGDYMALRYAIASAVAPAAKQAKLSDGNAVVTLDDNGEARFVRIDSGQGLQQGEYFLRFRKRGESVRLASDAFFFEERTGRDFVGARYGEVRVNASGDAVLTGLLDSSGTRLGPPLHQ